MSKITYDDLFLLLEEMTIGANDKTRTIEKVSNSTIRELISEESNTAISKGVTSSILALGSGVAVPSVVLGIIGGASTGAISTGFVSLGVASLTATAGAFGGGAAGSAVVPVVGTIIGAVIGTSVGIFATRKGKKKEDIKKALLMQEVLEKQNTIIRAIEKELKELIEKYKECAEQNDRYKYVLGLLMANEGLKIRCGINVSENI